MTAVKDDVTTGARQQDIYSKATNAGFVPNKDNTGFTIVYDDDVYIYDAGLGLVNIEPVPDSKNDGEQTMTETVETANRWWHDPETVETIRDDDTEGGKK